MRTKKGVITSAKMKGTVTVTVHSHAFHPIYKKRFRKSKKFHADSNGHDLYAGDQVVISECRPLSKLKHFKVTEIIHAAPRVSEIKEESVIEEVINREKDKSTQTKVRKSDKDEAKKDATEEPKESEDTSPKES